MTVERMSSPGGEEAGEGGRKKPTSFLSRIFLYFRHAQCRMRSRTPQKGNLGGKAYVAVVA
jgi:hypothetical protein